ncbi:PrgI family protein, partial [Arcanobacterium bovis]|uniref:PrgI family protein n=1 Tax=Arcanobacterium bovis TaxID=2529275 RepID=UPI00360DCC81
LAFVTAGENTGILAVMLVSIPGFAFGWLRPMGIDFEKYVGFWWKHFLGTKHYTYRGIDPLAVVGRGENNGGEAKEETRRSRKTRIAFEQAN